MSHPSQLSSLFVPRLDEGDDAQSDCVIRHVNGTSWEPNYTAEDSQHAIRPRSYPFPLVAPVYAESRANGRQQHLSGDPDNGKSRVKTSPTCVLYNFNNQDHGYHCISPSPELNCCSTPYVPQSYLPFHASHDDRNYEGSRFMTLAQMSNASPQTVKPPNQLHFPPLPTVAATPQKDKKGSSSALRTDRVKQKSCAFLPRTECNSIASPSTTAPSSEHFSPYAMLSQNLKNDPHRQAKIKTEMCLHYKKGKCPFGERCNYAHGEEELKFKSLLELENHGIIDDASTYRIHPCFSYVSTGSCPFGQRCLSIHDPRVMGNECHPSWLPHLESPIDGLPGVSYVETRYHERMRVLRQSNPLIHIQPTKQEKTVRQEKVVGEHLDNDRWEDVEWKNTYDRVVNAAKNSHARQKKPLPQSHSVYKYISELQRLGVALCFLQDDKNESNYRSYMYQPSHLVYNELCMVSRTKYVRLIQRTNSVEMISKEAYYAHKTPWGNSTAQGVQRARLQYCPNDVVVVYEICFGPVGRQEECRLCFDISPADIIALSKQQVKKFRKKGSSSTGSTAFTSKAPTFDSPTYASFFFAQPVSDVAHNLCIEMILHRIQVLKLHMVKKSFSFLIDEKVLDEKKNELKEKFRSLKRHHNALVWPINQDRENFDVLTGIPPVGGPYKVKRCDQEIGEYSGTKAAESIWTSFTATVPETCSLAAPTYEDVHLGQTTTNRRPRLSVFRNLSDSNEKESNKLLPLPKINNISIETRTTISSPSDAWKSILFFDASNGWEDLKSQYNTSTVTPSETPSSTDNSDKKSPSQSFRVPDLPLSARTLFPCNSSSGSECDDLQC